MLFSDSQNTAWKVSKYGVFSAPNAGKYGPEKTPYLDTFHAVKDMSKITKLSWFASSIVYCEITCACC